jgi:hypothetical protein
MFEWLTRSGRVRDVRCGLDDPLRAGICEKTFAVQLLRAKSAHPSRVTHNTFTTRDPSRTAN